MDAWHISFSNFLAYYKYYDFALCRHIKIKLIFSFLRLLFCVHLWSTNGAEFLHADILDKNSEWRDSGQHLVCDMSIMSMYFLVFSCIRSLFSVFTNIHFINLDLLAFVFIYLHSLANTNIILYSLAFTCIHFHFLTFTCIHLF